MAYRHAEAARRRAARLPVVREATAETAYAAGEYAVALNEYRAMRRMTGGAEYLPVLADCERALGRPQNALKLAREAEREQLDATQRVEMLLVEAGARADMGQQAEAIRLLKRGISDIPGNKLGQARMRYAFADLLEDAGDTEEARKWFVSALKHDTDQTLDAQDRINALDGFVLEVDESEDDEASEPAAEDLVDRDDKSGGDSTDGEPARADQSDKTDWPDEAGDTADAAAMQDSEDK